MVSLPKPPTAQIPWTPTAHAFAQHQFSQVTNFWKQGRQATFRLEALPGGQAELNLTFQLPSASEVVPPPSFRLPAAWEVIPPPPQVPSPSRPITPLFPKKFTPANTTCSGLEGKSLGKSKVSSKKQKSYRRAVLHRATTAALSLPTPSEGTLRYLATDAVAAAPKAVPCFSTECNTRPAKINCPNCDQEMQPLHQCEDKSAVPVASSSSCEMESQEGQPDTLPLCLYCCHLGSDDNPVHFFQRCLCSDDICSCRCYCTDSELKLKRLKFTHREWELNPLSDEQRAEAHLLALSLDFKHYDGIPCKNKMCTEDC